MGAKNDFKIFVNVINEEMSKDTLAASGITQKKSKISVETSFLPHKTNKRKIVHVNKYTT